MQKPTPMPFGRWIFLFLIAYGLGQGIFAVLVGFALNLRIRSLWLPYLLLICCGFVGACLIYWARQSYDQPRSGTIRFAFAVFLLASLYMGALLFGAVKLAILSADIALTGYAPYVLPVSVSGALVVYVMARRVQSV